MASIPSGTGRDAATLQCLAAFFRDEARDDQHRGRDLRLIASCLDHMAASLLVPSPPQLEVVRGCTDGGAAFSNRTLN